MVGGTLATLAQQQDLTFTCTVKHTAARPHTHSAVKHTTAALPQLQFCHLSGFNVSVEFFAVGDKVPEMCAEFKATNTAVEVKHE